MKLKFKEKKLFGKHFLEPACEKAELLLKIMNRNALKFDELDEIEKLGFDVELLKVKWTPKIK